MIRRLSCFFLLLVTAVLAADPVAARLAREAEAARKQGQLVRAYLLYTEAAARDKTNPSYAANRDALQPSANLLSKADIENVDIKEDIQNAERDAKSSEPPVELVRISTWRDETLQSTPRLKASKAPHSFDLRADERELFRQVTAAYGIRAVLDPQLDPKSNIRFAIENADFRTALEALADVTGTFVFSIANDQVFVARDTEAKRQELEPEILLTFPLPNALEQKDLIEAANAVRSVLGGRAVGWDSTARIVMVRDRVTRARVAYSLLEAILLPKAQVSFEVQVITLDKDLNYHYGLALPTAFQLADYIKLPSNQNTLPDFGTAVTFLTFKLGSSLLGVGLGNANFYATYTNSFSHVVYDATVVVSDGQSANLHVGDQYPIPQALYSGPTSGTSALASAVGQISFVDLGLVLKLTPKVNGEGEIAVTVEAAYKALGTQTFNTVPAVLQREFKGSIMLREGELAVVAGLDSYNTSSTRNGLIGLSQVAGVNQLLSENTRDTQTSQTLLLVKPTITRLPMSNTISPQYLLGPARGQRVIFDIDPAS